MNAQRPEALYVRILKERASRERRGGCGVGGRASSKLTRIQERGEFTQAFFDTAESLVNL